MPLFTPQTARFMAARSAEGRRQAKLLRLQRDQMLDRLIIEASNKSVQPAAQAPKDDECPDDYVNRRLQRVRLQIEKVDSMLEAAEAPAEIDRLASATARLSELERLYARRPLPGSLRPVAPRRAVATFTPPTDG